MCSAQRVFFFAISCSDKNIIIKILFEGTKHGPTYPAYLVLLHPIGANQQSQEAVSRCQHSLASRVIRGPAGRGLTSWYAYPNFLSTTQAIGTGVAAAGPRERRGIPGGYSRHGWKLSRLMGLSLDASPTYEGRLLLKGATCLWDSPFGRLNCGYLFISLG